jgi:hypothetical protein
MNKKLMLSLVTCLFFSNPVNADNDCELPPDIDEDESYWIQFKGDSSGKAYKILEIEGCWIQTYRTSGAHVWQPINTIEKIAEVLKKK